jgi:hypothetical protein
MKIAFFVSSAGDTDLALASAKVLRKQGYQTTFIPLSKTAEDRVQAAAKLAPISQQSFYDLIMLNPDYGRVLRWTNKQTQRIQSFLVREQFSHIYVGVPSERDSEMAFQIAEKLHAIPALLSSEFMFRPHPQHSIWKHLPKMQKNTNLHWSVPLKKVQQDFALDEQRTHITGHLSIDRALQPLQGDSARTKRDLAVTADQILVFMSSTTQPIDCDRRFLNTILAEAPKHTPIQIRLGLHPGIKDLDQYLDVIIRNYEDAGSPEQLRIILPPTWRAKFKQPELHISNPKFASLFIFEEINGEKAAAAAEMVIQAVPGALLNEATVRGKPVYTTLSKEEEPCLPCERFASSPARLFGSREPLQPLSREDLGLSSHTAGEANASALLSRSARSSRS